MSRRRFQVSQFQRITAGMFTERASICYFARGWTPRKQISRTAKNELRHPESENSCLLRYLSHSEIGKVLGSQEYFPM